MDYEDDAYLFDEKPKRKRNEDPTRWADAFKAIGIFLGTLLIFGIVADIISYVFLGSQLQSYYKILGTTSANSAYMGDISSFSTNPISMIVLMLLSMIAAVITLFIIYGLIHVFATRIFKGEGTLRGLIVRANIWTTGTYIAVLIAMSIQNIFMINTIVTKFEGNNIGSSLSAMQTYNDAIMGFNTFANYEELERDCEL